jgi:hypothetical protein
LQAPHVKTSPPPFPAPSSCVSEVYISRLKTKTIRLKFNPNVQIQNTLSSSRFDVEDHLFFVRCVDHDHNDWGVVKLSVLPDIECLFFATSWGLLFAPQCSIATSRTVSSTIQQFTLGDISCRSWYWRNYACFCRKEHTTCSYRKKTYHIPRQPMWTFLVRSTLRLWHLDVWIETTA